MNLCLLVSHIEIRSIPYKQETIKNNNEMTKEERQPIYVSPRVKIMNVKVRAIVCASERQNMIYSTEMTEGDDNW